MGRVLGVGYSLLPDYVEGERDDSRARNRIDQQNGLAQNNLTNLREGMIIPQAQSAQNNYTNAAQRGFEDYDKLMGGYQDFQKTGGYSPIDINNIRQRSVSPIRSIYAGANREVDRQRSLQGGYSPNYTAAKTKMAREQSMGLADANTNVEGMLAQMVNQGKQFGLQGGSNLYGTTPGLANHFGSMQNSTMNNWLQQQQLQNQLSLGTMNAQIEAGKLKGPNQQAWDNVLNTIGTVGSVWKP